MSIEQRIKALEKLWLAEHCDHNIENRDTSGLEKVEDIIERLFAPCERCGWRPTFAELARLADEDAGTF